MDEILVRCLCEYVRTIDNLLRSIIALFEPSSPVSFREKIIAIILIDLRRRDASVPEVVKLLERDDDAQKQAIHEVEHGFKDINGRLTIKDFGFTKPMELIRLLPQPSADPVQTVEQHEKEIELAIKNFNGVQKAVFYAIAGAIQPRLTADDPFASVYEPKIWKRRNSRSIFFDAPGVTGKTLVTRTIQSFLE